MKQRLFIVVLLASLLLAGGCQNQTLSQEAKLFEAEAKLFTASVNVATVLRTAQVFTPEETAELNIIIHQTQLCLNAEAAYLKDPRNMPEPDWFNCAATGIGAILDRTNGKAVN